ncbi:hypothetical protein JW962_02760 [Candidatus Dojkabacteria bacterium]|nr:hypothetical protein [Candidatus Dojkabacteria bacterium]
MAYVVYKYKRWLGKKPVYTVEQAGETYSVFRFLSYVGIYWIFPYPICYGYVLVHKDKTVKLTPGMFRKIKHNLISQENLSNYIKNAPDVQTERMYPFIGMIQTSWLTLLPIFIIINLIVILATIGSYQEVKNSSYVSVGTIVDEYVSNKTLDVNGFLPLVAGYWTFDDGTYAIPMANEKEDKPNEWGYLWVVGTKDKLESNGISFDKYIAQVDSCADFVDPISDLEEWNDEQLTGYLENCFYYPTQDLYGRVVLASTLDDYDFIGASSEENMHLFMNDWFSATADEYKEQVLLLKKKDTSAISYAIPLIIMNLMFGTIFGVIWLLGYFNNKKLAKYFSDNAPQSK